MPLIAHRRDPAGIEKPIIYEVENGTNILKWLSETFASQDELSGDLACSFILNGKEIFRSDHENKDESILNITISNNDTLIIINRPGFGMALWTVVQVVIAVVSVAMAVYTYMNMPEIGSAEVGNESPNSRLSAGTNSFRPYQAIPEIFGAGVAYPDFVQPSFYFYDNNIKKQVGLFCLTVGEAAINAINVGTTNINSIAESNATVFLPGQAVPQEFLQIHTQSTEIDGQVLIAQDDNSVSKKNQSITAAGVTGTIFTIISIDDSTYVDTTFLYDINLVVGDYLYIRSGQLQADSDPLITAQLNGAFQISEIISFSSPCTLKLICDPTILPESFSGTQALVGRAYADGAVGENPASELDNYIGWYTLAGAETEEVWINWTMPYGLRSSGGGAASMKVQFDVQAVNQSGDRTGDVFTKLETLTKNTATGQYQTLKFTKANTPGMPTSRFAVRAKRVTNVLSTDGSALEQVQLESVSSVTPYYSASFGNVTMVLIERKATLFSADQAGKKINIEYTRKLPSYNRTTGVYDVNDLQNTRSFADAAAYTLIVAGNETTDTVDLAELYGIYDGLSNPDLGEFSFTFDDADLSKGERVDNICKVARVISFHDGVKWRFSRDEVKSIRSALFNRRSTVGNQAAQSWQPQRSDDSDSVRIIYVDPDSNTEAYIDRSFNTGTGEILDDQVGVNLKEINLAGCRNITQATNRADLEIRRLAYQRRSVTETTYRDAMSVDLLDRVGWCDINDIDTFDGEIMGVNGDIYDTTERFEPVDGETYVVFITDVEGYPSNTVQCLPRTDTDFGFIAVGISGAYVASGDQQVGSRYFIANSDDLTASNFTMTSRKPNDDGTVTIELAEYRAEMYEKDGLLPASASPIVPSGLVALKVTQEGTPAISVVSFTENGIITLNDNETIWYSEGETAGIGALFEVKATVVSGSSVSGPLLNTWHTLNVLRSWNVANADPFQDPQEAVVLFEVRQIDYTSNHAQNSIEIIAVQADPVALPSSITIVDEEVTLAVSSITVNSNGTYTTSDGQAGTYTTTADNIGQYYEAFISSVAGDAIGGDAQYTWIQLNGAGASWSLTTTELAAESSFNLIIREIADPLNTATMSVTLMAGVV